MHATLPWKDTLGSYNQGASLHPPGPDLSESRQPEQFWALVDAMGDPVRCKIITALTETEEGMSVRRLSERIGEPPGKVRYHLHLLDDRGLVTVVGERQRRGVMERYYRPQRLPIITTQQSALLDEKQSKKIALQILARIIEDARAAIAEHRFGTRVGQIRVRAEVDPQGWEELNEIYDRTLADIEAAVQRSATRMEGSKDCAIPIVSGLLLFEAASGRSRPERPGGPANCRPPADA
jgi:DNA-binding transcriptional ArsR family regulator